MSYDEKHDEMISAYAKQIRETDSENASRIATELYEKAFLDGERSLAKRLKQQLSVYEK